ncbi:MAG TPA: DICT sensory domain-containing protein [Mycobacteriales bacterium]
MAEDDADRPGLLTKRMLVTLSHAIEQAALAPGGDGPVVVLALFQRVTYFDREREAYRRLADHADVVVVGFADDFHPELPGRAHPVLLELDEPLAREWSIVVVTRETGAYLVAHDEERVSPGERTLEAGRLFSGRWGFRRDRAVEEARRLRRQLDSRLPPGALMIIDEVLGEPGEPAVDFAGQRNEASLRLLTGEMDRARRRSLVLQERLDRFTPSGDRDPASRLHTDAYLRRWVGATRSSATGPLPLALVLVVLDELRDAEARYGSRAARQALTGVATAIAGRLGPGDRAVRLGDDEFLLVAPGATLSQASVVGQQVSADIAELGDGYPFLPLAPIVAVAVSRERPLPVRQLRRGVEWARSAGVQVAALPS